MARVSPMAVMVIGLPIGFGSAAVLAPLGTASALDFVATLVLGTAVAGCPPAWLVKQTAWHERELGQRIRQLASLVFITILATTMAVVLANLLPHGRWVRLPPPPEPASSIAGYDCTANDRVAVYIQSHDGQLYRYLGHEPSAIWTMAATVRSSDDGILICSSGKGFTPPPPSGRLDAIRVDAVGADCRTEVAFILRTNGEVWAWGDGHCALSQFLGWFVGCTVASALAVIVGVGCMIRARQSGSGLPPLAA